MVSATGLYDLFEIMLTFLECIISEQIKTVKTSSYEYAILLGIQEYTI